MLDFFLNVLCITFYIVVRNISLNLSGSCVHLLEGMMKMMLQMMLNWWQ